MNLFSAHNQTVQPLKLPRPTVTEILHVNKILLSPDKSAINAFVDQKIREERERELKQLAKELNPDSK